MRGSENGNRYSPTGIEELTRSGEMISLLDPRPEQIHMKDIAAHLAAQLGMVDRMTVVAPLPCRIRAANDESTP